MTTRIMVVDDDRLCREALALVLRQEGFKVLTFGHPLQAFATYCETPDAWSVMVTDHNMPGMDGLDLIRAVQAVRPDMPCFLCTGESPDEVSDATATAAGAWTLFRKPLDARALLSAVTRAVTTREPARYPAAALAGCAVD